MRSRQARKIIRRWLSGVNYRRPTIDAAVMRWRPRWLGGKRVHAVVLWQFDGFRRIEAIPD